MFQQTKRLAEIIRVIFKYRLYTLLQTAGFNNTDNAVNLTLAFEELGTLFIKLGQILSTRHDLVSFEFAKELSKLQDNVKPFPNEMAHAIIKKELNQDYHTIFSEFSDQPMASASVAQVYSAKIANEEVVVKILRPNLIKYIQKDLRLLKFLIKIILKLSSELKRFKPEELLVELERVLADEQDLQREAANASQLRRNFIQNNLLYIPKVYWKYSSKNILVLERIRGISINNIDELKAKNVDLHLLAKRGVELFFTQVFEHCLFHGDLHPGNIFVNAANPLNPTFYAVDFGIMGSLGPKEQHYLAHNLWAFLNRDYRRIAELHIESGWVDPHTRVDLFESAIRTVSEPILEMPVAEISFGKLLVKLFDVAKGYNMQLQPQLLVFKKSLINVESIARRLDPDLDLWATSRPFVEKWMRNQLGFSALMNKLKTSAPNWSKIITDTPDLIFTYLNQKVESKN